MILIQILATLQPECSLHSHVCYNRVPPVVIVVKSLEEDPFSSAVDVLPSFPSVVDVLPSFLSVVVLFPPFLTVVVVNSPEEDPSLSVVEVLFPFPSVVDVLLPSPSVVDLLSPFPALGVVSFSEDDPSPIIVVVSSPDVTVVGFEQFLGSYDDPGQFMDPEKTFFLLCSSLFTKVPFSLFSQHTFGFPLFVDPLKTQ